MKHADSGRKKIVTVGGGTGTNTVLRGLKRYADQLDITAIVTMADSGGSTGRLRDEFGHLPVGDVRMALAALSADVDSHDELLRELFMYRFARGEGLTGHNFGSLLLTALTDLLGSEEQAIAAASRILRVRGRVIPVTIEHAHLKAEYDDGTVVIGEHDIDEPIRDHTSSRIRSLSLEPAVAINPAAASALEDADVIIFGPGDLYTSVLANAVVDGFVEAVKGTQATIVYVMNLMTKAGQTNGMAAEEHIAELGRYIGRMPDHVLYNTAPIDQELISRYQEEDEYLVRNNCMRAGYTLHELDLVANEEVLRVGGDVLKRSLVRHDGDKLANAIIHLL